MNKTIILFSLIIITVLTYSQTEEDKKKAYEFGMEAITLMDNGEIDESIKLLEKSCELDPENTDYPYEIGYAYYLKKDYTKSIEYYEKTIKMDNTTDQCYQMLGNIYDLDAQSDKAIETYKKGLEIFPNSGRLYLELGNMHYDNFDEAIIFYEKGIEVEPTYPSNYYWATKIFCSSTEEIWGMFYGEMFMNIERGSKRKACQPKLLVLY